MQTFTFLSAGIDGSTSMSRRLQDAYAGVLAGQHRLVRAGLAAPGGEEAASQGGEVRRCSPGRGPARTRRSRCSGRWWRRHGREPDAAE